MASQPEQLKAAVSFFKLNLDKLTAAYNCPGCKAIKITKFSKVQQHVQSFATVCNVAAVMLRKLHVRLLTKVTWSEYIIFIC